MQSLLLEDLYTNLIDEQTQFNNFPKWTFLLIGCNDEKE